MRKSYQVWLPVFLGCLLTLAANAQSFRVQCPTSTITHPVAANNNSEPAYMAPTYTPSTGAATDSGNGAGHVNGNGSGNGSGGLPAEQPAMTRFSWAAFLLSQTEALTDVFAAALDYASKCHGNHIKPEDVRALMTTAFINLAQRGGLRAG